MTAFGKLIRTTAFRLTLVYLFLFALFAASLLGYFAWNTRRLITEQITTTVNAETGEVSDIFRPARPARSGSHHRESRAAARRQSLSRHHAGGAGDRRQCRLAGAGRDGDDRLVGDRLPPARRAGQRQSSRAGAGHRTLQRLPAADRARSGGAAAAVRHRRESRAMVGADRGRARPWRRHLRRAAGAAAHRRHDRHDRSASWRAI